MILFLRAVNENSVSFWVFSLIPVSSVSSFHKHFLTNSSDKTFYMQTFSVRDLAYVLPMFINSSQYDPWESQTELLVWPKSFSLNQTRRLMIYFSFDWSTDLRMPTTKVEKRLKILFSEQNLRKFVEFRAIFYRIF